MNMRNLATGAVVSLFLAALVYNFNDIRRYIRISMM